MTLAPKGMSDRRKLDANRSAPDNQHVLGNPAALQDRVRVANPLQVERNVRGPPRP